MITSLLRQLRLTLDKLTQAETELIASYKEDKEFRTLRQKLTLELREVFDSSSPWSGRPSASLASPSLPGA